MNVDSDVLSLDEIIEELEEEAQEAADTGERVKLGEIIARFEERGFGPLIFIPALIAVIPTGAIPGVPSICGILIALISIQMVVGNHTPWLPSLVTERSISGKKMLSAVQKIKPFTAKIGNFFYPRLEFLTEGPAEIGIAVCCALAGLCMIPLELIPMAAAIPGLSIMLAAIGLATKDGIAVAVAISIFSVAIYLLWSNFT